MPRLSKIGAAALAAFGWTGLSSVAASYLQVAGGGGSSFGGGGAGGYLTGTTSLDLTKSYTVVVGAGGAQAISTAAGTSGGNSSITDLTASVGGGGGGALPGNGVLGGSGGGGVGSGTSGGAATAGQGNAGGTGTAATFNAGGGGGGSGGVGGNSSGGTTGGNAGIGTASSISGTSVTYAGGGSGASTNGGGQGSTTAGGGSTANLGGGGNCTGAAFSNGGSGVVIISYPSPQKFGGGIVTTSGSNTIHTFTTSGTLSPLSTLTASYLIVAGGGSGGGQIGGGGGAGGLLSGSGVTIDTNSIYVVSVGSGGTGTAAGGTNGTNSTFSIVSTAAVGGGAGGSSNGAIVAGNGGSGGGGGGFGTAFGTGTAGQGNDGGVSIGAGAPYYPGGGGGGASSVGGNATATVAGVGGTGTASSISGTSVTYAAGASGGRYNTGSSNGVDGTANTGNGGSGSSTASAGAGEVGGNGGSGIVIISYAGATQLMAGGTVTISGGNVIHTFTSSGYLTPLTLVGNSLRFRSSASAYLNRTPSVASNRQTWTWSGWVKHGSLGSSQVLFSAGSSSSVNIVQLFFSSDNLAFQIYNTGTVGLLQSTAVYRDPAAWYHVVAVMNTTNATSTNRMQLYVNGVQITAFGTATYPSQNFDAFVNTITDHSIGSLLFGSRTNQLDGYLTEINFIDGQALTPNSFGTFNSYGVWQPITYGGSYGTNGFYLPFTNTTNTTTLGLDFSPQNNNWTANNFSLARSTYTSYTSSSGTYTVPAGVTSLSYLVVAGGGGGGSGGGGAGGLLQGTMAVTGGQTIAYSIGAGGAGGDYGGGVPATNGSNTTFGALTAIGGGAGTFAGSNGTSGGSGSGGAGSGSGTTTGGAGTSGQGFAGGGNAGNTGSPYPSGGGGGAGAIGSNAASSTTSGAGGAGITWVNGTTYAGGGGGGTFSAGNPAGAGGSGGGGAGGSTANGTAGSANTGGGGGGSPSAYIGGAGGSGIIIIGTGSASTYDSMTDVPTLTSTTVANYCVLTPLAPVTGSVLSNGNLTTTYASSSAGQNSYGSIEIPTTGQWYWEVISSSMPAAQVIGIWSSANYNTNTDAGCLCYISNGQKSNAGTNTAYGASFTTGDVIGVAFDAGAGTLTFYKNNTSQGTAFSSITGAYFAGMRHTNNSGTSTVNFNFGQQPFVYTPPSGFLALNTFNL